MLTSMMYMLRKRTMAVIKAKAFWWNTGSEVKKDVSLNSEVDSGDIVAYPAGSDSRAIV